MRHDRPSLGPVRARAAWPMPAKPGHPVGHCRRRHQTCSLSATSSGRYWPSRASRSISTCCPAALLDIHGIVQRGCNFQFPADFAEHPAIHANTANNHRSIISIQSDWGGGKTAIAAPSVKLRSRTGNNELRPAGRWQARQCINLTPTTRAQKIPASGHCCATCHLNRAGGVGRRFRRPSDCSLADERTGQADWRRFASVIS